ncbi:uncharacterized protein [Montipora capricornis]|uniref:uncharacterized protein n=1 Tax=Montipora capricornis TaxID=246305 RepID=UPI0035F1F40D
MSTFEVLPWESSSKEQDSLVNQLFGKISNAEADKTPSRVSRDMLALNVQDKNKVKRKGEKRKEINDDGGKTKPKEKRKDKRDKSKFKTGLLMISHPERTQDNQSERTKNHEGVTYAGGPDLEAQVDSVHESNQSDNKKIRDLHENESESIKTATEKQEKKQKKSRAEVVNQDCQGRTESAKLTTKLDESRSTQAFESKVKNSKREKSKDKKEGGQGQSTEKRKKTVNDKQQDSFDIHIKKNGSLELHNRFPVIPSKLTVSEKMTKQLESSRFRWINEQLYTTTGEEAVALFSEDPSLFDIYHRGFTNQVGLWPVNPVDMIIQWLRKRASSDVIADFGCGEAVIAQSVQNKVHSFDLVAKNELVTACNMAKVPLKPASVDVVVFCLSLMGTNLVDFLREAHRVLKLGGFLKVAEVTSRISDTAEFIKSLSRLGFKLQQQDTSNKMFVLFDFIKDKESFKTVSSKKLAGLKLKPCIYKKR